MKKWLLGLLLLVIMGTITFLPRSESARADVILRDWDTPEQLQGWMDDHIRIVFTMDSSGVWDLSRVGYGNVTLLDLPMATSTCVDYSMRLSDLAAEDGYRLSLALTDMAGNIGPVHVASEYHMGNLAVVQDDLYFVEPQADTVVYIGPLRTR